MADETNTTVRTPDKPKIRLQAFVRSRIRAQLGAVAAVAPAADGTYDPITREEFLAMAGDAYDYQRQLFDAEIHDITTALTAEFAVATTNPNQENEK